VSLPQELKNEIKTKNIDLLMNEIKRVYEEFKLYACRNNKEYCNNKHFIYPRKNVEDLDLDTSIAYWISAKIEELITAYNIGERFKKRLQELINYVKVCHKIVEEHNFKYRELYYMLSNTVITCHFLKKYFRKSNHGN